MSSPDHAAPASSPDAVPDAVPVELVLFDLDGVIRLFDPTHREAVEVRHDVEPGSIRAAAFDAELLGRAITGAITTAEWIETVGHRIGSHDAAIEWSSSRGRLDPAMLDLLGRLRSNGLLVAVLTNGTTEVTSEFTTLGLIDHVDEAFNTADIGFAKPDVRAFRHVCDAMSIDPRAVFFTDDTESKLTGADELGMRTHHFAGIEGLEHALRSTFVTF